MVSNEPVISKTVLDENGKTLTLDYFITSGICLTDGAKGIPSFGIRVQLSIDGIVTESLTVDDVSPSEEATMRMAQLFAKNLVTPVSLKDIIEDSLASQI